MLPHLTGAANPEYDAYARGAFSGATLEHGRGHFARAIMEAVACMLRRNLEQLDAVGVKTDSVYCLGGGVNSRLWLQIKADLTGSGRVRERGLDSGGQGECGKNRARSGSAVRWRGGVSALYRAL